jgi:hypothetical protein
MPPPLNPGDSVESGDHCEPEAPAFGWHGRECLRRFLAWIAPPGLDPSSAAGINPFATSPPVPRSPKRKTGS